MNIQAIIALILVTLSFGGGWVTRDAFCDSAAAKAQVSLLQAKNTALNTLIDQQNKALKADAEQFGANLNKLAELEKQTNELQSKISVGVCLTAPDVDGLRSLWK